MFTVGEEGGGADQDGSRKEEIAQRERENSQLGLSCVSGEHESYRPPLQDGIILLCNGGQTPRLPSPCVCARAKRWRRYLFAGLAEALQALLELTAVVLRRLDALLRLLQEQVHLHRHPPACWTDSRESVDGVTRVCIMNFAHLCSLWRATIVQPIRD